METKLNKTLGMVFLCLFFTNTLSFGGIIIVGSQAASGPGTQYVAQVQEDCSVTFPISIFLANLSKDVSNPNSGFNLPSGAPKLFLSVKSKYASDLIYIDPDDFSLTTFMNQPNYNGERLYHNLYWPTLMMERDCNDSGFDGMLNLELSFLTENGSPYPLEIFSHPGQLFSCTFFTLTCGLCENPDPNCPGLTSSINTWYENFNLNCCECTPSLSGCGFGGFNSILDPEEENNTYRQIANSSQQETNASDLSASIDIFPNPFDDNFTLEFEGFTNEVATIEVFSLSGKLIHKELLNDMNGYRNKINVSTSHWISGIYMVKVTNEKSAKYHKIIKR